MKPIPTDPRAMQARVIAALCDDLFDIGARRSTGLDRTNALRTILTRCPHGIPDTSNCVACEGDD